MKIKFSTWLSPVLIVLILLDLFYAVICFFFPQMWFSMFHGTPYDDPEGLLRRTGAIWATFSLLQLIALLRYRQQPYWVAVIAGVRLSEIFADWTYLAFAQNMTAFGRIGLLAASPSNMIISWYFLRSYWELASAAAAGEKTGGS